jgi:hypothetical protein
VSRRHHIRELAKVAEALGYTQEGLTSRQHVRWRNAQGVLVITASDLPTTRHMRNCETFLRRYSAKDIKSILAEKRK